MGSWIAIGAVAALSVAAAAIGLARPEPAPVSQAGGAHPGAARTSTPDGRALKLTFSEDFSAFRPACGTSSRWRTAYGDGSSDGPDKRTLAANGELETYVDPCFRPDGAAAVGINPFAAGRNGLEIVADRAPGTLSRRLGDRPYVSGLLTTQPSFSQTYGYFEMRARLPRGKGLWPAFWLLPADLSWPPEIDVMESIGDPSRTYATVHSKLGAPPAVEVRTPGSPDAFHTYAVAWDPKFVIWYVDDHETARQRTPADLNKPMFMLVNLAVGGGWPGKPDASTPFPARFSIQYVRAYRFAS